MAIKVMPSPKNALKLLQAGRVSIAPRCMTPAIGVPQSGEPYPSKLGQGLTVFFTGLPASGKSSIARATAQQLSEHSRRRVTLLDGDIVRQCLSSDLGFS